MGWRRWAALLTAGVAAACGIASQETIDPAKDPAVTAPGRPKAPQMASPPLVVVVGTDRSGHSRVYRLQPGRPGPPAFATVLHRADATPRAALHPTGATLLAASQGRARDRSFDYVLFRIDADGTSERLVTSLTHAGQPHVDNTGRVLVVRGEAGAAIEGETRVDRFSLDEVDLATGATRSWHEFDGHHLHLAATGGGEAYLYRVAPHGADLVAVDAQGQVRVIRDRVLPYARDFSLDAEGHLIFRQRHRRDPRRWQALRIDADGGSPEVLYEGETFALAPHAWPGGGVLLNPRREGMSLLGSQDALPPHPMGPGVDLLRATSTDQRYVALLHTRAGVLPRPFVVDRQTGRVAALEVPDQERIAIAGFAEGDR